MGGNAALHQKPEDGSGGFTPCVQRECQGSICARSWLSAIIYHPLWDRQLRQNGAIQGRSAAPRPPPQSHRPRRRHFRQTSWPCSWPGLFLGPSTVCPAAQSGLPHFPWERPLWTYQGTPFRFFLAFLPFSPSSAGPGFIGRRCRPAQRRPCCPRRPDSRWRGWESADHRLPAPPWRGCGKFHIEARRPCRCTGGDGR